MKKRELIMVTGGAGYLGSVLVPMMLESGYKVRVVDRFFWGKKMLPKHPDLELLEEDTRTLPAKYFKDVFAIIDLAALSNDPIGELEPRITKEINFEARLRNAKIAKANGVKKYILASSCSVYGFQDGILNEKSKTSPVTTYARASLMAEEAILPLSGESMKVTVLRQGTLYGISPRMRFDVVLNTMVMSCFKNKYISVTGGEQWRPLVSVEDSARAFLMVLKSNNSKTYGEVFNVGGDKQNYQIKNLAKEIVKTVDPKTKLLVTSTQSDFRSYRVSFKKIKDVLGFRPRRNVKETAQEIYLALKEKKLRDSLETRTIDWYRHLLAKNKNLFDTRRNVKGKI